VVVLALRRQLAFREIGIILLRTIGPLPQINFTPVVP